MPFVLRVLNSFVLASLLAACGGGGGIASVGSVSGPVQEPSTPAASATPLAASVATTAGTYSAIAWSGDLNQAKGGTYTAGILPPSAVTITVEPATHTFTIDAALSDTAIHQAFDVGPDFGNKFPAGSTLSDGTLVVGPYGAVIGDFATGLETQTSSTTFQNSELGSHVAWTYVSYGNWAQDEYMRNADGSDTTTRQRQVEFVYGVRTDPSDLPASGHAAYGDDYGHVSLDADFGARTVAANIDYPARTFFEEDQFGRSYYVGVGVKASGKGSIGSNADFAFPLAGTSITPDPDGMEPDLVESVTGSINGAFFGPKAAEAGGLASIIKDSGETVWEAQPFALGQ